MKKLVLALVLAAFTANAFAMEAEVISTKGKTEVQQGNSWKALSVGDKLPQGAVIQTGFKSEVVLKIKGSTVTVDPLSRITLQKLIERSGKDDTALYLSTGTLKSDVKKSNDRKVGFTVRSPVATASVRGTGFNVATQYQATAIDTWEGSVASWINTPATEKALDEALDQMEKEAQEEAQAGENPASGEAVASSDQAAGGDAAPQAESKGSSAKSISEFAPAGAFTVAKGQTASFGGDGSTTSPAESAHKASQSMPGASAGVPGVGNSAEAVVESSSNSSSESTSSKKGSITVTIEF